MMFSFAVPSLNDPLPAANNFPGKEEPRHTATAKANKDFNASAPFEIGTYRFPPPRHAANTPPHGLFPLRDVPSFFTQPAVNVVKCRLLCVAELARIFFAFMAGLIAMASALNIG